ncbi:DUF6602 domain-containing protein [Arthrobacter sp. MYb214]|uniref:DUF6602 domain-containing protein n=1 Tax=Arthrobacter sp. MYb214 TaxID=1848596 RepID=UPI0011B04F62|nr:DUF6602 domain-containing protein [Arthrobacter sp. MYb214]
MNSSKPITPPAVQRYWNAVSNILRIESQEIAGLVNHIGTRGTADENSIIKVLDKVLPPSTRVSNGEVIDSDGRISAQMDALVLSNTSHPVLFGQTADELIFPVESVLLAIEVKGNLSKADVQKDIVEKVRKHYNLNSSHELRPVFAVFAHEATSHPRTVAKWFHDLPEDARPEFFLVNDSALFGIHNSNSTDGYQIVMPFAPKAGENEAMELAQLGGFEAQFWRPMNLPTGQQVRVDHGAGMLLFIKAVLDVLSERGFADAAWLERYLDKVSTKRIRYVKDNEPVMELQ